MPETKLGNAVTSGTNYRPTKLLNNLVKLPERIIHIHLFKHHNPAAVGLPINDSSIQQLKRMIEYVIMENIQNRLTQLIVLDIEKASDNVWHSALLTKLH